MSDIYNFEAALAGFNHMYGLPVNDTPTVLGSKRLKDLKQTLLDEVNEIDEIIAQAELIEEARALQSSGLTPVIDIKAMELQVLVGMADLMGDIQVYCGSEMKKWGLPQNAVLRIIMESNKSKLGADGLPIINEAGKVEKGPNYWKPQPMLHKLLQECILGNRLDPEYLTELMIENKASQAADKQG